MNNPIIPWQARVTSDDKAEDIEDHMLEEIEELRMRTEALEAEYNTLQAQLAAAQGQEPIGFVESAVRGAGGFHACFSSGVFVPAGTQLYTAPIPQQAQPVQVNAMLVEALQVAEKLLTLDRVQPQVTPLPDHEIVTMYAECPNSDAEMLEFARAIEAEHGIKQGGQHD